MRTHQPYGSEPTTSCVPILHFLCSFLHFPPCTLFFPSCNTFYVLFTRPNYDDDYNYCTILLSAMLQYVVNAINSIGGSPQGPTTCILTCFPHKAYKYVYMSQKSKKDYIYWCRRQHLFTKKTAKLILCLKKWSEKSLWLESITVVKSMGHT